MTNLLRLTAGGASIALAVAVAPTAVVAQNANATTVARADLRALNNSGASGQATLRLSADQRTLTVQIKATGLEQGGVHVSHIHGLTNGGTAVDSVCPTTSDDIDGDRYVELGEGLPKYGPILINFNNVDPDADGRVDFTTTVELTGAENVTPLQMRHIVIHGLTVPAVGAGTPGEVDGTAGYKTVLPVLCGEIRKVGGGNMDPMKFRVSGHTGH